MRRALLFPVLVLLASPAAAQTWTYAASDHFDVYATGGSRHAREALTYFERVHTFLTDFLAVVPRRSAPTRLIVFTGDRQFAPYRPNQIAAAFFLPAPDRDYIVMKSLAENAHAVVNHEYAHLLFRHSGTRYPLWLDEGLAEFFSTMAPEDDKMGIGRPPLNHLQYLNDAAMLPLDRLFAVTASSPEYNTRAHAGAFYSQSWALTHMLLADDRYRAQSGRLLHLVSTGVPGDEAFAQVYARTLDSVSADLHAYVRRGRFIYYRASYKAPPSLGSVPTRRVDDFEAGFVTANLLAGMLGRDIEARAAFDRLAAQRPNDTALLESIAYFELRRGRPSAALPFFARAVAAGSRRAALYRDYAMLDPSRAEELLPKAIALDPGDLQARLSYASLLVARRRSADAVATLMEVTDVPPHAAYRVHRLLAGAYMQLERLDEARAAAVQAQEHARPGEEAASIAALLKVLEDQILRRMLQPGAAGR